MYFNIVYQALLGIEIKIIRLNVSEYCMMYEESKINVILINTAVNIDHIVVIYIDQTINIDQFIHIANICLFEFTLL